MRSLSLALKFVLELLAFAALAYWGARTGRGATSVLLAIAAPAVAIALWAVFAAPRSARRLPLAPRIALELGVFAAAVAGLFAAGAPVAGIVLTVLVAASTALLTRYGQWEA